MIEKNVMTIVVDKLDEFVREIQYNGKNYKVNSVSIGDEFEKKERLSFLLKKLIFDHNIKAETLNDIGFSNEDSSNLGMSINDLKLDKIPERSDWEDEDED
jgi:hypothetical protein